MNIKSIDPEEIIPLDAAKNDQLLVQLVENMTENGWQGRPLLVIDRENGDCLAWTGSHRIEAAREVGLPTVPCYVIQSSELIRSNFDEKVDLDWAPFDHKDRMAALVKLGDENAIHLMWQEDRPI
jgi:hypothetical protein